MYIKSNVVPLQCNNLGVLDSINDRFCVFVNLKESKMNKNILPK